MDKKERLIEVLKSMVTSDIVDVHNKYCEVCNYPDDVIYPMWQFEEQLEGTEIMNLVNMIYYGEFNPTDNYFWFDGNGNLSSADHPEDASQIYIGDIANAMLRKEDGFGSDECQEIIDDWDEEEE